MHCSRSGQTTCILWLHLASDTICLFLLLGCSSCGCPDDKSSTISGLYFGPLSFGIARVRDLQEAEASTPHCFSKRHFVLRKLPGMSPPKHGVRV